MSLISCCYTFRSLSHREWWRCEDGAKCFRNAECLKYFGIAGSGMKDPENEEGKNRNVSVREERDDEENKRESFDIPIFHLHRRRGKTQCPDEIFVADYFPSMIEQRECSRVGGDPARLARDDPSLFLLSTSPTPSRRRATLASIIKCKRGRVWKRWLFFARQECYCCGGREIVAEAWEPSLEILRNKSCTSFQLLQIGKCF